MASIALIWTKKSYICWICGLILSSTYIVSILNFNMLGIKPVAVKTIDVYAAYSIGITLIHFYGLSITLI
jgi:hypothetical protein